MIRRRSGQRSFGDVVLFGTAVPDPEKLMDPVLRRIDVLLDDEELVDQVLEKQRHRFALSARRGRQGTPAEIVLRLLVLKHLKGWSYEQVEWEVTGNLVYRRFCRIDAGRVPDAKTMVRQGQLLEGEALRALFDRIVAQAVERRVTRGRKMRIDTTVVETDIRYPSDSRLCEDVTEVLSRHIQGVRSEGVTAPRTFRKVHRSVARRTREITAIARRRIGPDKRRQALRKPYGGLLRVTRQVIRQAREMVRRAKRSKGCLSGHGRRSVRRMEHFIELGQRVVAQTKARIFKGISNSKSKIVSIFEPHTRILRRGKMHKPTEFGVMVKVQESENGIVTDIGVTNEHDTALLVPGVQRHCEVFGRAPTTVSTDRGFYSTANVEYLHAMKVRCPAIPKPGYRSPGQLKLERSRRFRKARAWRAGGEARISRLKNTFDMARSRYRGERGTERSVYWAGIANNLVAIARHQ